MTNANYEQLRAVKLCLESELDSAKHKAILVLDSRQKDSLLRDRRIQDVLKRNTEFEQEIQTLKILKLPIEIAENPVLQILKEREWLQPGEFLLQSPLNKSKYYPIEIAPSQFAIQKFNAFTEICKALGATKINIVRDETTMEAGDYTERKERQIDFRSRFFNFFSSKEITENIKETIRHISKCETAFVGSPPDVARAKKLLIDFYEGTGDWQLQEELQFLIEQSDSLVNRGFSVELSNDFNRTFNSVATLTASLQGFFNAKTGETIKQVRGGSYKLKIDCSVTFENKKQLPVPKSAPQLGC